MIFLTFFMIFWCRRCYADSNGLEGALCLPPSEAESSPTWTENRNSMFRKLEANVILNNGYYIAEAGEKGPDRVYGLIQCRGDISKSNCTNCTRDSFNLKRHSCGEEGKTVMIWQKWCFLRYSNERFYGVWERTSAAISSLNISRSYEQAAVASKGMMMMMELAAAAPEESLMFAKGVIDDGLGGKRYGLTQCTRDLGKSDCRGCLESLLNKSGYQTIVFRERSWDIYGVGCFVLYGDTQFYFNTSAEEGLGEPTPPKSNAANRGLAARLSMAITIFMTTMAFL
ncbi:hypothetical protein MIMGU_mgv1a025343mg [Erythranthe guttata]|uniref:Gnk2-homologous domain-containing protein n=2 Tax=Erythranthe guttata TaxID=4155 RepID=A0A022QJT7_ERYGU|nr:hypothetical protein MIMGU_mgv1a025343mg [Erythranthe guttata]